MRYPENEVSSITDPVHDCSGSFGGTDGEVSFRKRYFSKLVTNLLGMIVGIVTQSIVPRALGPASYGNFSFLTNFFQQIVGFLNLNSSTAFFTKLSQRQEDKKLVSFYMYIILLLGIFLGLFVAACFLLGKNQTIWPDQYAAYVVSGAGWAFLTFCALVLNDMSDAYGLTVKSEMVKLLIKFLGMILILLMFWQKLFSLTNFFIYHYFTLLLTIVPLYLIIHNSGHSFFSEWRLSREQFKSYSVEFSGFCLPLVVFSGFAILEGILDRWFLQKYAGSVQQGFYGLSYQIGSICFLFCSAMIPLLAREYAISFAKKDMDEMRRLFSHFVPMLYVIAAYFSCFLAIESKNVMLLFGGKAYAGAVVPITIMCFYPIHQTYGQINASVYFATSRTVAYRNIGIALIFVGLPLTFLLLGPREYGGLQSGATGLAGKMLFMQIISVNIQLWFNLKLMKLSFIYFLLHQVIVVFAFISTALLCSYAASIALREYHTSLQFLFSGVLYTCGIMTLVFLFPSICALQRFEITKFMSNIVTPKKSNDY